MLTEPPPEPAAGGTHEENMVNNDGDVPADSWEEAADAATPSPSQETPPSPPTPATPDDDEDEDADSEGTRKIKKKPIEEDENSKKEPVNVIFIGHVG